MLVMRTVREHDLDQLIELVKCAGAGMTTLKADRKLLAERIANACDSFAGRISPERRDYVFVMEDVATGRLAGVSAIKSAVGLDEPFYNYRIGTLVHSSEELGVYSQMDTLYLSNDLTGNSELCSLFLHPDYRSGNNGKLLSKCRLLFIAQFPHVFPQKLIAEMRGWQREDGSSPFWESLGRHFFKMDFSRADDLSTLGRKSFIAELMPRYPLYVALLPEEARQVIGRVHNDTVPARRMLEQEGMYYEGYVDIFDAGPVLQSRVTELRALRDSALVAVDTAAEAGSTGIPALVCNTTMADFRAIVTPNCPLHGKIALTAAQRQLLGCGEGETVRSMPINPQEVLHA